MSKELRAEWQLKVKLATLESAEQWGNVSKACRAFGVSRAAFYRLYSDGNRLTATPAHRQASLLIWRV